jgi:hypothetical protein
VQVRTGRLRGEAVARMSAPEDTGRADKLAHEGGSVGDRISAHFDEGVSGLVVRIPDRRLELDRVRERDRALLIDGVDLVPRLDDLWRIVVIDGGTI